MYHVKEDSERSYTPVASFPFWKQILHSLYVTPGGVLWTTKPGAFDISLAGFFVTAHTQLAVLTTHTLLAADNADSDNTTRITN